METLGLIAKEPRVAVITTKELPPLPFSQLHAFFFHGGACELTAKYIHEPRGSLT